jgi:hypothetical protein
MEQNWRTVIDNGGTVTNIEINILYNANKRPIGFEVDAKVNGVNTHWSHTN